MCRQSGQKEKSLVFESGEQEKTGALIGGCQGDGPWGLLNFFRVLPPEQSEASLQCPPGLKAEGSGVDPELGGRVWARETATRLGLSPEDLGFAEQQEPGDRLATQSGQVTRPFPGNTVLGATRACP